MTNLQKIITENGRNAFWAGRAYMENPYADDAERRFWWSEGHNNARVQAAQAALDQSNGETK
jgi:hypothetical protein